MKAFTRVAIVLASFLSVSARPGSALVFQEFGAFGERIIGQSSSDSASTTFAAPGLFNVENARSVVSQVGINVNADAAPGGVAIETGFVSFEVGFALAHTQSFDMILDFALRGQLLRVADQSGCLGSVSIDDVSIPTLVRVRDGAAFPINVLLEGEALELGDTTAGIEVARDARVTINFRGEPVMTEAYRMTFQVSALAISQSCEVSARFGAANGSTTSCEACDYPGFGDRSVAEDGIFVTVSKISLCGDGATNAGEDCDLGASNGAEGSCCTEFCEHAFEGRICRPAAGECDVAETCTGQSGDCPDDRLKPEFFPCTSDDNDCTDDFCSFRGQCVHVPNEGASCQNEFFCDGGEFCSPQGQCVTSEPPPCSVSQTCDEENNTCVGPTATPNGTALPTATANPATCQGDCNGDDRVAINELVLGVRIALGDELVSTCPSFDRSGDSRVSINELIAGVNNALAGCPD